MKKFFIYVFVISILFCATEFCLYLLFLYDQKNRVNSTDFAHSNYYAYSLSYKKISDIFVDKVFLRKPVLFGSNKKILIFGCAYAYGASLDDNQTLGYKLAENYKATVYNHSYPGWGIQHMYWQLDENRYDVLSYDKDIDTILYVYMDDHINRLYSFFWAPQIENFYNVRYRLRNGNLEQEKIILPFVNVFYLTKALRNFSYSLYKESSNYEKNSDELMLAMFRESKRILVEKYPSANFILIEYNSDALNKIKNEIADCGWKYYSTNDFLPQNVDLNDEAYHFKNDPHPTEKAWNVVVDAIYKNKLI